MSADGRQDPPKGTPDAREARLAKALRDNLRRRKLVKSDAVATERDRKPSGEENG